MPCSRRGYAATLRACYLGYVSQAVATNLAPLLFGVFRGRCGFSYSQLSGLVLACFVTQVLTDLCSARLTARLGFRRTALFAHGCCAAGLALFALLPALLPRAYVALLPGMVLYSIGGGLMEVIVSPITEALPNASTTRAFGFLHAFYCWGQVLVIVASTLLLRALPAGGWPLVPLLWALLPLGNLFNFATAPLPEVPACAEKETCPARSPQLRGCLLLMLCAGACEMAMSQWSSLFAEQGLGVPKVAGDLLGPGLFALCMGLGRVWFALRGERVALEKLLGLCAAGCFACYLLAALAPAAVSLTGCALCGLCVGVLWPAVLSHAAQRFPRVGAPLFGLLAVFGDVGCSLGPAVTGFAAQLLPNISGGGRAGLLAAAVFPLWLLWLCRRAGRAQAEK